MSLLLDAYVPALQKFDLLISVVRAFQYAIYSLYACCLLVLFSLVMGAFCHHPKAGKVAIGLCFVPGYLLTTLVWACFSYSHNLIQKEVEQVLGLVGLKWKDVGTAKPKGGIELTNGSNQNRNKLAEALTKKTEFAQVEWDAFEITGLRADHFVQAGGTYFQPAPPSITHQPDLVGQWISGRIKVEAL